MPFFFVGGIWGNKLIKTVFLKGLQGFEPNAGLSEFEVSSNILGIYSRKTYATFTLNFLWLGQRRLVMKFATCPYCLPVWEPF